MHNPIATLFPGLHWTRILELQIERAQSRCLEHRALAEEAEVAALHHHALAVMYEQRVARLNETSGAASREIPPRPRNANDGGQA